MQSDIEALLRELGVGSIESHYQLSSGEADIYLPNRRAFIECKAFRGGNNPLDPEKEQSGRASESPRQQVERYVFAEMGEERWRLPFNDDGMAADAPWTAIVTDGMSWYVYRYDNERDSGQPPETWGIFFNEAEGLVKFLRNALGSEMLGKEWIPEKPGVLFSNLKVELDALHKDLPKKAASSTLTKQQLWLDMMKASGMVPNAKDRQTRLFVAHSFLIVIVRLVSHTLTGTRRERENEWKSALKDGFASWVLDFKRGERWAERTWDLTRRYDWASRRGDVLRDLYHEYVPKEDRKVFGEYYTPDWLAAMMVEEVLDDAWIDQASDAALEGEHDGIGVLDPSCGSGTFLYHAARRILNSPSVRELPPVQQADVVTRLVHWMDIHPVAVEIARVNIERSLPAQPSDGSSAFCVFLGDSLQWPTFNTLFDHEKDAMRLTSPKGKEAFIPISFVKDPSFAENMRQMVNAAAEGKELPPRLGRKGGRAELKACHEQFVRIIKDEGNSVWTWYAVNVAGPHLLTERKVDRIVANPPWVKLSDIQVSDRKLMMEELGKHLGIHEGGKQAANLDIASFFVLRARTLYLSDPERDPGAWLVKKSAIQAGQWRLFRTRHAATLAQSIDLQALEPFGGGDATRCCVLMEHRPMSIASGQRLSAKRVGQRRPLTHEALTSAREKFELIEVSSPVPQAWSQYDPTQVNRGADIHPHVLCWIASSKTGRPGWTHIETKTSSYPSWVNVPSQTGKIPTRWVRPLHTSSDMLPYIAMRKPPRAIIPIDANGKLHKRPGDESAFWSELDEIFEAHSGEGGTTPSTLIEQFDFRRKLSAQPMLKQVGRRMLLYPKSGDIMRAARTHAGMAVVDATLYWIAFRNESEAGYLVALLNARCLRRAFAECKESGRDFHLHPWKKVPIPKYDRTDRRHVQLADLCKAAENIAKRRVEAELTKRPNLKQQGLSKAVREAVSESKAGQEIERIAAALLPDQAD